MMPGQLSATSDFTETLAIHAALKAALKGKVLDKNAAVKKAASSICRELEGERSIYGRQLRMISLMEGGATLVDLGKKLRCSRRTVFRYLNELEEAGIPIKLEGASYIVDHEVSKLIKI
jgi:Fic family protein